MLRPRRHRREAYLADLAAIAARAIAMTILMINVIEALFAGSALK